jgi:YD repeat-containing protein
VTVKDLPGTTSEDVYYAYDNLGQLLSQRLGSASAAPTQSIVRTYDALGRVVTNTVMGRTLSYGYDLAGRRTRLTWPDGVYVDYTYDTSGAPKSVLDQTGATLATVTYDDLGRATGLGRGNGAGTGFGYDGMSRLTGLTQSFTGPATNNNTTTFTRNPASQITSRTQSNDAVYSFTGASSGSAGTPLNRTNTMDGLNRVTAVNSNPYGYDTNGNPSLRWGRPHHRRSGMVVQLRCDQPAEAGDGDERHECDAGLCAG